MKYQSFGHHFTTEQRQQMRETIARALSSNQAASLGLTPEIVYNTFTHKGGLHGLSYSDFENFQQFKEAKQNVEEGQFFTPPAMCEQLAESLHLTPRMAVADLTCGMGNFFNFCPVESNCFGVELDAEAAAVARYLYPAATILTDDLRYAKLDRPFDVIFGNPPFNLRWDGESSQMVYVRRAAAALKPGGRLALIIPAAFLADAFHDKTQIAFVNEAFSFLGWSPLSDVPGFGSIDTKVMFFMRRADCLPCQVYDAMTPAVTFAELSQRVAAATQAVTNAWAQLTLIASRSKDAAQQEFAEKVARLRCDIARHGKLQHRIADADALIYRLKTQQKPEQMSWKEWATTEYKPAQLLKDLKVILREQNPRKSKAGRLIKRKYGLEWNGRQYDMSDLVSSGNFDRIFDETMPNYRGMKRLYDRKRRDYLRQAQAFEDMRTPANTQAYLNHWRMTDRHGEDLFGREIVLTAMQKRDIGLFCQKDAALMQWEQGAGKTLALLCWNQWQRKHHPIRYTIITSSAIAIATMWQPTLTNYRIAWRRIASPADLQAARPGECLLITFNALGRDDEPRLYRALKQWVREQGEQHLTWLCDESHNLCNPTTKQTRYTTAALRRVRYKFFATATSMLNKPTELFPQLEALLNNSANLIYWAQQRYERDGEELLETPNPYFGKPYPAYKRGYELFTACHSPDRVTVFGIAAGTQDLLQLDALTRITSSCILTRTFEEVRGDSMLDFKTYAVEPNAHEIALMVKIMEELHGLLHYFHSTGDSRKDAGLRLVRQLMLLIRACSIPQAFKEYTGDGTPTKMQMILNMVAALNEPVLIGVTMRDALTRYAQALHDRFPNRPRFVVSGDVPVKQRATLAAKFQASGNGILLATQQSLSESINIPEVNQCILESLQWNAPKLAQFFSRIRRFNSTRRTTVHCVTYADSIEQNRLGLILAKQRLTDAVKFRGVIAQGDLMQAYGLNESFLEQCLRKTREKMADGTVRSKLAFGRWGTQTIN